MTHAVAPEAIAGVIAFLVSDAAAPVSGAIPPADGAKQDPAYIRRWQDRGQFPYGLRLPVERQADAASQSPGSGDGLSPGWRQAWARRESWHGRQGTCS